MDTTFLDYQYPELSMIRMIRKGVFIITSPDSEIGIIRKLEDLFK